jgi:CubicO group peptidase (beta-lactamase class C family)
MTMKAVVRDETFSPAGRLIGREADMDRDSRDTDRLVGARPAFRAHVLGVLFLLGAAASYAAAAMRHVPDAGLAKKIDAYIRPFVESENFPGAILVARGDNILFSKAYGMANYELKVPNTPRHRFHLASLTKMFTAAAVLLLEERGKLATSDTVAKFLPDYPNGDKILLEHLLTHTAGVPNADFSEGEGRVGYTTEQLVAKFKTKPLDFEPGSRARYSNSNYNLLAYIVEKVSGQSYGEYLKVVIFDRLGMKSTLHDGDASALIEDRASGTVPDGFRGVKNAPWVDWSSKTGSGSLVSTTEDLARFVRAEFGGTLLKPESLAKVMQKRPGFPYGWSQDELFGRKQMAVGGRSPGFITAVQHYPEDGTTIIVLTNSYSSMAQDPVVGDIAALVYGQPTRSGPVAPVKPKPGQFAGVGGRYQMPSNYYAPNAVLVLQDRGDYLEARWEQGEVNVIYPVSADECLDRMYWARVRFQRDPAGKVTGFTYHLVQDFSARKLD